MADNPNSYDRDHSELPEVVCDRDLYVGGVLWAAQGQVLTGDMLKFAHSREGRRVLGVELPNPVPLEPPLGYVPAEPLHMQIRRMVENEISLQAAAAGGETLEESEDFDVGDDYDPMSPWELEYEPTRPWFTRMEVEAAEARALASRPPAQESVRPGPAPGGKGTESPDPVVSSSGKAEPPSDSPQKPGKQPSK